MLLSRQQGGRILRTLVRLAPLVAVVLGARAQNLVPNPGFESYRKCPTADYQFDTYVADWKSMTTLGSPDYFNARNTSSCSQNVPATRYGFQSARDSASGGAAFAGIYCSNISVNYREYMGVKLTHPLEKGRWYSVRFFASLAEASPIGIMNLGAYIGRDSAVVKQFVYPATPQITCPQFITNSDGWTEISGMYQAAGDESFMIIGCFDDTLRTTPSHTGAACSEVKWGGAYYFIDDVSITPADPPSCFNTSDYYDIAFKPAGVSTSGTCCWDVDVTSKNGACPLYGVSAFLPSGTVPFAWHTDSPVMPGETRSIGHFCFDQSVDGGVINLAYLNQAGAPMSGTQSRLQCGASAAALAARAVPFDGGSSDFCTYDLYIDNTGDAGAPIEEIALHLAGGEFQESGDFDWSRNQSLAAATTDITWHAADASFPVPPRTSIHVGRFSVGATSAAQRLTATLYQHPPRPGVQPEKQMDLPLHCTIAGGECYNALHAGVMPSSSTGPATNGCYLLNVRRDSGATCEVAGITLANATPEIAYDWQPFQLGAPPDLDGQGRDMGTLCFDINTPPELSITYYDAAGTPICTQRLLTSRIADRSAGTSGVRHSDYGDVASIDIAPNPARGATTITYNLERDGDMRMDLFDLNGKLATTVADGYSARGEHTIRCDTHGLAPGVYRLPHADERHGGTGYDGCGSIANTRTDSGSGARGEEHGLRTGPAAGGAEPHGSRRPRHFGSDEIGTMNDEATPGPSSFIVPISYFFSHSFSFFLRIALSESTEIPYLAATKMRAAVS